MCKSYFAKQRIDIAGVLSVRLQKLLLISLVVVLFPLGITFYDIFAHNIIYLGTLNYCLLTIFIISIGWRGAKNRNGCALLAFFVMTMFMSIYLLVGFLGDSVGRSIHTILELNKCAQDIKCKDHAQAKAEETQYNWIVFLYFVHAILNWVIPLFFHIISMFLSLAVRKELMIVKQKEKDATPLVINEEEGYSLDTLEGGKQQQHVEQQPSAVPAPIFYTPQGPVVATPQGYLPLPPSYMQNMMVYMPSAESTNTAQ